MLTLNNTDPQDEFMETKEATSENGQILPQTKAVVLKAHLLAYRLRAIWHRQLLSTQATRRSVEVPYL